MASRADIIRDGFYFFIHNEKWHTSRLHYTAANLCDGLRKLGAPLFSNVEAPIFTTRPLTPNEPQTTVFLATEGRYSPEMAGAIAGFPSKRKLILSCADIGAWFITPPGVLGLFAHMNRFLQLPAGPRIPWPFGLSEERIAMCLGTGGEGGNPGSGSATRSGDAGNAGGAGSGSGMSDVGSGMSDVQKGAAAASTSDIRHPTSHIASDFWSRKMRIVANFRPSSAQGVRNALDLALVPHLARHFEIDRSIGPVGPGATSGGAEHYERLRASVGCLAYGGDFASNLSRNPELAWNPQVASTHAAARWDREPVITRWDSWRFWESLGCGCLTFHVDLEKYGCQFAADRATGGLSGAAAPASAAPTPHPAAPIGWEHYIPVDLEDPRGTVERLMAERDRWPRIAAAGREWALREYSPGAVTERFLGIVEAM